MSCGAVYVAANQDGPLVPEKLTEPLLVAIDTRQPIVTLQQIIAADPECVNRRQNKRIWSHPLLVACDRGYAVKFMLQQQLDDIAALLSAAKWHLSLDNLALILKHSQITEAHVQKALNDMNANKWFDDQPRKEAVRQALDQFRTAEFLALIFATCDDYFVTTHPFFAVTGHLPLELQTLVATHITGRAFEQARFDDALVQVLA